MILLVQWLFPTLLNLGTTDIFANKDQATLNIKKQNTHTETFTDIGS